MMKVPKKVALNWIVTGILLGGLSVCCKGQGTVSITTAPQNMTVTRSSDVAISCGYKSVTALRTAWLINGTMFTQEEIRDSPLYQLNSPNTPASVSLTVFSINGTTTFQCVVESTPTKTSPLGTVIVIDVLPEGTIIAPPENTTVCRGSDVTISCGHVIDRPKPVVWIINGTSFNQLKISFRPWFHPNKQSNPSENSLIVFSINGTTTFQCVVQSTPTTTSTLGTITVIGPNVTIKSAYVTFYHNKFEITVSWQAGTNCTGSIIMYNVSLMDQDNATIVIVPANVSFINISESSNSSSVIVANRVYNITISAISDHEYSYPSDPFVVNTFILQNCSATSPSIGTIRVSCDSSHQILVTLTCTNNCSNPMVTSNGSSPLTVKGLDVGVMYNVTINVFNGSQVVLNDKLEVITITVMRNIPDNNESTNDDSGGGSAGAIAGGVIGGIIIVIIIMIIIIVIYFIVDRRNKESVYDDTTNLKSPPGIGGIHASEGDSNVQDDKVLYAAPAQIATIPHQTSASGEQYAVSTKTADKTNEEQPSSVTVPHHASDNGEQYAVSTKTANKSSEKQPPSDQCDSKKGTQEITYADLQALPNDSQRNDTNHVSAVTYSQIA